MSETSETDSARLVAFEDIEKVDGRNPLEEHVVIHERIENKDTSIAENASSIMEDSGSREVNVQEMKSSSSLPASHIHSILPSLWWRRSSRSGMPE